MYVSPHPPLDIPRAPLVDFVLERTAERGKRAALVYAVTGRTIAYEELRSLVDRTAAGLAELGIGKGDVCAVFAPNSPDYLIAVLAIARLGAVTTTASPLYTKDDLAKQLEDSGAHEPVHRGVARAGLGCGRRKLGGGARRDLRCSVQRARRTEHHCVRVARPCPRRAPARRDRAARPRRAVLERHHGLAERRDAHARESRREHSAGGRGRSLVRRSCVAT